MYPGEILHWIGDAEVGPGGSPALGDSFVIISNDGSDPVINTFNDLPQGGFLSISNLVFRISYTGGSDSNDVVLTR